MMSSTSTPTRESVRFATPEELKAGTAHGFSQTSLDSHSQEEFTAPPLVLSVRGRSADTVVTNDEDDDDGWDDLDRPLVATAARVGEGFTDSPESGPRLGSSMDDLPEEYFAMQDIRVRTAVAKSKVGWAGDRKPVPASVGWTPCFRDIYTSLMEESKALVRQAVADLRSTLTKATGLTTSEIGRAVEQMQPSAELTDDGRVMVTFQSGLARSLLLWSKRQKPASRPTESDTDTETMWKFARTIPQPRYDDPAIRAAFCASDRKYVVDRSAELAWQAFEQLTDMSCFDHGAAEDRGRASIDRATELALRLRKQLYEIVSLREQADCGGTGDRTALRIKLIHDNPAATTRTKIKSTSSDQSHATIPSGDGSVGFQLTGGKGYLAGLHVPPIWLS